MQGWAGTPPCLCTHASVPHAPKRGPTAPAPPPLVREGGTIHAHTHHHDPQSTTAPHHWRHTEAPHKPSKSITAPSGTLIPPERRKSLKTAENRLVYIHTHTHPHTLTTGMRSHSLVHAHARTPTRAYTRCTRPRSGTPTHTLARSHPRAHIHTHTHARTRAHARAPTRTHAHTREANFGHKKTPSRGVSCALVRWSQSVYSSSSS